MTAKNKNNEADSGQNKPEEPAGTGSADAAKETAGARRSKEIGGRDGPDPTRYGDWEKAGRCIDF